MVDSRGDRVRDRSAFGGPCKASRLKAQLMAADHFTCARRHAPIRGRSNILPIDRHSFVAGGHLTAGVRGRAIARATGALGLPVIMQASEAILILQSYYFLKFLSCQDCKVQLNIQRTTTLVILCVSLDAETAVISTFRRNFFVIL